MTRELAIARIEEGIACLEAFSDQHPYMDEEWLSLFAHALQRLENDGELKVLLLRGGETHFSAGGSREFLLQADLPAAISHNAEIPRLLISVPVPTLAAMEGHAVGGGFAFGLWCDQAFLAEESLYGANFMAMGLTPGMGVTRLLEESLGATLSRELLFSGRLMKGAELAASRVSLAPFIVPRQQVWPHALAEARRIAQAPREALVLLKQALSARRRDALAAARRDEAAMHQRLLASGAFRGRIAENYPGGSRGEA